MSNFFRQGIGAALLLLLAIAISITLVWTSHAAAPTPNPPSSGGGNGSSHSSVQWGVDTTNVVDSSFCTCVAKNYGTPTFYGRYLKSSPNAAGLTANEVSFIHKQGAKVMIIYNNFTNATGATNGQKAGQDAVAAAKSLGVPGHAAIFADIETNYTVDAAWIQGYVDTLTNAGYAAGIYANPASGGFLSAYASAASHDSKVTKAILWSSQPSAGITSSSKAPAFHPNKPSGVDNTLAWQYGIAGSGAACKIDTDLIDTSMAGHLW